MHFRATIRRAARPTFSAKPVIGACLVAGATVAAIAQPLEYPYSFERLSLSTAVEPSKRAATIRIALPPTGDLARANPRPQLGSIRIALDDLQPKEVPESRALAASSGHAAESLSATPLEVAPADRPIGVSIATAKLGAARTKDLAAYPTAVGEIALSRKSPPIPMVDAESRAAVSRMYGVQDWTPLPAPVERTRAFQSTTVSGQPLVDSSPLGGDAQLGAGSRPLLPGEAARPRKPVRSVSFSVTAMVNGNAAGEVSLLIRDGDSISVRMTDLLPVLEPVVDPALYERVSEISGSEGFVSFNALRSSGIEVRFDDRDRLILHSG